MYAQSRSLFDLLLFLKKVAYFENLINILDEIQEQEVKE